MNRAGIRHDGLLRVTHQALSVPRPWRPTTCLLPVMLAKMLKKSDNLYADTFLKTVGRHYYNKPGSYRSGTMAVRAILTKHGIDLGNATPGRRLRPLRPQSHQRAPDAVGAELHPAKRRRARLHRCRQAPRWTAPWPGAAASPPP